jgi:putative ABC transport system permease protein
MASHKWSCLLYRILLHLYPREFRERFGFDLEADFAQMITTGGRAYAWSRAMTDVRRALPLTTTDAMAERARANRVRGPILPPGETPMRSVLFDLRHAIRALLKTPAFTVVTLATLTLGIGANTAVFSLVNAVLLRPLGYADADRLVLIHEGILESGVPHFEVSPADYLDFVQLQHSFSALGAYRTRRLELSGGTMPDQIVGAEVSSTVFPVLGVGAALGRVFLPDEDAAERNVVVISDAFWRNRLGGRDIADARILLDRKPYTVVGVMPAGFEFPKRGPSANAEPADVWLPLVFNPFERQARGMMYNHSVVARMRDGITIAQASADSAALAPRIRDNYPADLRNALTLSITTVPLFDEIAGQVRRPLLILLGSVALVLLIACANVANLMLSRWVARRREVGIRAALGAGRLRLIQMLLAEALLLALGGGALGLALAYWAIHAIPAVITTSLPGISNVEVDAPVVIFTLGLSVATATFFGLVPLGTGARRDLHDLLRDRAHSATGSRLQRRIHATLAVASVAFAFILLISGGLLLRSLHHLLSVESGIQENRVLTMQVRLPAAGYPDASRMRGFYQQLEQRLVALPAVRSAAVATDLPLDPDGERRAFTPETGSPAVVPSPLAVTWIYGDYFAALGVPVVRGRIFASDEQRSNRLVAVVNRRLAQTYWPGQDPVGKRFKWGIATSAAPWQTVIGVVGDVSDGPPGAVPLLHIYAPYAEIPDRALAAPGDGSLRRAVVVISSDQDPASLVETARRAVAEIDPALAVSRVQTLAQLQTERTAPQRFSAMMLGSFAAGALLLAAIGLYGVLAFAVSQRRQEIGIRIALGARSKEVVGLIVREGMSLVLAGVLVGIVGSVAATRALRGVLYDTPTYDPLTMIAVPLVLTLVAFCACYIPARRAARVDPMLTIRPE